MKYFKKEFIIPIFLIVIALFAAGISLYIYKNKKVDISVIDSSTQLIDTQTLPLKTSTSTASSTSFTSEGKVLVVARQVLEVLASRNYQKLEELVSPDGLSMSLYPQLDFKVNLIAKTDVSLIPTDTKTYLWGYTDGKGDPINLTRSQFVTTSIYDGSVDYLKAPEVAINKKLGSGNSQNTIDEDVDGRIYVAFYFSEVDPKNEGHDWTTLYLIFDYVQGEYKLRGIAKDNWTI